MTSTPATATAAEVCIRRGELHSPVAMTLIGALNDELSKRYPEAGATHFRLDADEVTDGRGAFLIAWTSGRPVGCGAIRRLDAATAEIKRMYVEQPARGTGVGRALLTALEAEARSLAVLRIVLETGERQLEALALYSSAGFARIPRFGEYAPSELSICMAKDL
jgi:GNAT superfamily N-acetyltransferase